MKSGNNTKVHFSYLDTDNGLNTGCNVQVITQFIQSLFLPSVHGNIQ